MEEKYYLIKKDALDAIIKHLSEELEVNINNDCKLIDLSDEAINILSRDYGLESCEGSNDIYGYKRALQDLKNTL